MALGNACSGSGEQSNPPVVGMWGRPDVTSSGMEGLAGRPEQWGPCALTGPPGPTPDAWLQMSSPTTEHTPPPRAPPGARPPPTGSAPPPWWERTSAPRARVSKGPVGALADGRSVAQQAPKAFPTGALPCELEGRARSGSLPCRPGLTEPPRGRGPQSRVPGLGPPLGDELLHQSPGWPREGVANRHRQGSTPPREGCWWPSPGGRDRGGPARLRKGPEGQRGGRTRWWELRGRPRCVPGCTGG